MKPYLPIVATLLVPAASLVAQESNSDPGCCGNADRAPRTFRDAPTHDTIAGRGTPVSNPIAQLPKVEVTASSEDVPQAEAPKPESLISRSEILHRGNKVTLVPKRAVLHVPSTLRGALGAPANPELVVWSEFYRENRGWIDTVEVTRAQAEGWKPLSEELLESFQNRSKIVVATLQGGPISVLPVVEEAAGPETATKETP